MHFHVSSLATLPEPARAKILAGLTDLQVEELLHDWSFLARPEQLPPEGGWNVWAYVAGRGAGKTRTGAEWVRGKVKAGCRRIALIAATAADARDVMVKGESGLLATCWRHDRDARGNIMGMPLYEPSKRVVTWGNGATAMLFSAEEPDRLRGPQFDAGWCDELAAWARMRETWDMFMFGLRLGSHPQAMVTTTPKPAALLREIMKDAHTRVSRGSTFANAANLAPSYLAAVRAKYEGTRIGRQELYAELLEEAEGALWTRDMIDAARVTSALPEMKRIVVAVDPAITAKAESDETGIVAAGVGRDDVGYVLDDASGRYSPAEWARKALALFDGLGADRIVAEGNQGGDMVRHTIQTIRPNAPVTIVHASRGKAARAEPVAALYEQSRVRHAKLMPELEDQLVSWEPLSGAGSPDRLDAMVWGLTDLMLGFPATVTAKPIRWN